MVLFRRCEENIIPSSKNSAIIVFVCIYSNPALYRRNMAKFVVWPLKNRVSLTAFDQ